MQYLPEWLEEFTENPEDAEVPATAHISHDSDSERPTKVAPRKHSIYSLPERSTLRSMQANQVYEIARPARGRKLQGPRAEDAVAEPYLEQESLVT